MLHIVICVIYNHINNNLYDYKLLLLNVLKWLHCEPENIEGFFTTWFYYNKLWKN